MKEVIRTVTARWYKLLSCYRCFHFKGHKVYEQSIIVTLKNSGGEINFEFTDLSTNEVTTLENPTSGEYVFPLTKGEKSVLVIKAKASSGSYRIQKKTIKL